MASKNYTVSIDEKLLEEVKEMFEKHEHYTFSSFNHFVEVCIYKGKKMLENK